MTTKRRGSGKPALAAGANPPAKSYRTTTLVLGMVPIEVAVYASHESRETIRNTFVLAEDGSAHSVGKMDYDKVTGKPIDDPTKIFKGVVTDNGVVEVTNEELALGTEKVLRIEDFVDITAQPEESRWLVNPDSYYQIRAASMRVGKERRVNVHAEEALLLLFASMKAYNVHALVQTTLNAGDAPRLGVLDWRGHLQVLVSQTYIRDELPLPELPMDDPQRKVMDKLVTSMIRKELPANPDETSAHIERILEQKQAGIPITAPPSVDLTRQMVSVDLTAALEASLAQLKRPAKA